MSTAPAIRNRGAIPFARRKPADIPPAPLNMSMTLIGPVGAFADARQYRSTAKAAAAPKALPASRTTSSSRRSLGSPRPSASCVAAYNRRSRAMPKCAEDLQLYPTGTPLTRLENGLKNAQWLEPRQAAGEAGGFRARRGGRAGQLGFTGRGAGGGLCAQRCRAAGALASGLCAGTRAIG